MHRLGAFEQLLLLALVRLGQDTYGVPIRADIEARTGRVVSPGAIYTAIAHVHGQIADMARGLKPKLGTP